MMRPAKDRGASWILFHALGLSFAALAAAGCSEQRAEAPRLLMEPVSWQSLGSAPAGSTDDGFVLLTASTKGQFPASVVIARVQVTGDMDLPEEELALDTQPRNELLPWSHLFDAMPYVREAFPMQPIDLAGEPFSPERVLDAAARLNAQVCLLYGRGDVSESESLVRGVLFDTRTGTPLAAIAAIAETPPLLSEEEEGHDCRPASETDPRILAARKFEQHVFECLAKLHAQDKPADVQTPEGWKPEGPIRPRIWPPADEGGKPW